MSRYYVSDLPVLETLHHTDQEIALEVDIDDMKLPPSSTPSEAQGVLPKVFTCLIFLIVALYLGYLAVSDAMDGPWNSWRTVFRVAFASVASGLMFCFFYGAVQTPVRDFSIESRLLRQYGLSKMKDMKSEEYEQLVEIEKSNDAEIAERKYPPP